MIFSRGKKLQRLVRLGANLLDSENVKGTIARKEKWSDSHKEARDILHVMKMLGHKRA